MSSARWRARRARRPIRIKLLTASFFLFLVVPWWASGQELVLHEFISKHHDPGTERLLYLAAGIELVRAGLSSTRSGGDESYVLLTDYARSGGSVSIDYKLFRANARGRVLAEVRTTLPVDQNLDEKIGNAITELLRKARIEAAPSPKAEIEGLLPGAAAARAQAAAAVSREPPPAPVPVTPPPSPEQTTARPEPAKRSSKLAFGSSVSAAGAVFFGQMTKYFHYGVGGAATVGFAWPAEPITVGLGLKVSSIRVLNDYGVFGGPLYLSSAGLNARVGFGSAGSFRISAALSGGAALLTVASSTRTLNQTAPYGDLGIGASLPIGRLFSLGGELRFLVIVDRSLLVTAAMPAITVSMGR